MKRMAVIPFRDLHLLPMLKMLRDHSLVFWITVCLAIFQLALGMAISGVGAWMVGLVGTGAGWSELTTPFMVLIGLVVVAAIAAWGDMWLAHDLAYRVLASLREALFEALRKRTPGTLERERTGDIVSAAMADVETLEWFYAHTVGAFIASVFVPVCALILLGYFDPLIPLLLLPFLLMQGFIPLWFSRYASVQGQEVRKHLSLINANVMDLVQGLREVVCFGVEKMLKIKLDRLNRTFLKKQTQYGSRAGLENAASVSFAALGMVTTLIVAARGVQAGSLEPQYFPAMVILAGAVFGPVTSLSAMASQMGLISGAAGRVFKILHSEEQLDQSLVDPTKQITNADIVFDEVFFRYESERPLALNGLSFTVKQGEAVALAGLSGAGKTTCAKLLMRFFDPDQGAVKIGGHALNTLPQEVLRDHVTWVPQDIFLFDMTIAENIALAKPEASKQEIIEAAKMATAHEFINAMPQGYDTVVGERGAQLSGGQRQRVAIARALLKNTPIVILDEAVSNLDNQSERALQQAMDNLRQHRTTLIIAHRLSTLQNADRVVLIENGRFVETGSPQDLLEQGGPFATLVEAQFKTHQMEGSHACHS